MLVCNYASAYLLARSSYLNLLHNLQSNFCLENIKLDVKGLNSYNSYFDHEHFWNQYFDYFLTRFAGNGSNTLELAILIIVATVISVALAVGFIYLYRSKKSLEKCESKQNSVFPFRFSNMFNWGNDNIQYIVNHQIFNLWFQWLHLYFINLKMMKAEA